MTGLREFKALDNKRHNPAVGIEFGQTVLGKLLIVGLSHYGNEDELRQPDFTHNLVEKVIKGELKIRYFTKIAKLFRNEVGKPYSPAEFYSRIAFYNYLPYPFGGPKEPYEDQLANEVKRGFFFKVLDYYKPDRVLVTGERLWRRFVSKRHDHSVLPEIRCTDLHLLFKCEGDEVCCLYPRRDGGTTLVGAITHPSTAKFNQSQNRTEIVKWIDKFMAQSTS
jgi:hypothetical protein